MKWGVRRTPEQLGHKRLAKAKTSNMEKWGKDKNHNVCYITGYSGSGKSTVAKSIADNKTNVIHLDVYYDQVSEGAGARDKEFDNFLKKNKIKIPNEMNQKELVSNKVLDRFEASIEKFGSEQYSKGKKVIAEGIQVLDSGLHVDKNFYVDKPIMILGTNAFTSFKKAAYRDGRMNLQTIKNGKQYIEWYSKMHQDLKNIQTITKAQRGSIWVNNYLKRRN